MSIDKDPASSSSNDVEPNPTTNMTSIPNIPPLSEVASHAGLPSWAVDGLRHLQNAPQFEEWTSLLNKFSEFESRLGVTDSVSLAVLMATLELTTPIDWHQTHTLWHEDSPTSVITLDKVWAPVLCSSITRGPLCLHSCFLEMVEESSATVASRQES
jgi:hypothetical protein